MNAGIALPAGLTRRDLKPLTNRTMRVDEYYPTDQVWEELEEEAMIAFEEAHEFPDHADPLDREVWIDSWIESEWARRVALLEKKDAMTRFGRFLDRLEKWTNEQPLVPFLIANAVGLGLGVALYLAF